MEKIRINTKSSKSLTSVSQYIFNIVTLAMRGLWQILKPKLMRIVSTWCAVARYVKCTK